MATLVLSSLIHKMRATVQRSRGRIGGVQEIGPACTFILSIRRVAWHGMIWIRCFFSFSVGALGLQATGGSGRVRWWQQRREHGYLYRRLFFLLTELQKGDGRELNLFGQKGRLGLALHLGRGWVVASMTTHRGEGGLRVPMLRHRNHEPNRIEVSYLPILRPSSQRGDFIQSDIRARTGSEDGEEILYPIFFPIWAFACAWILGCFVSGFGGGISETYIRWGGYILQTHIRVERCHMKRIARN